MNLGQLFRNLLRRFRRYVICGGNDTAYLRSLGMQIGSGSELDLRNVNVGSEPWLINLGRDVTLAYGVILVTHDGASRIFRHSYPDLNQRFGNAFGKIVIEDRCFIGAGTIILPGVTIGHDSIVGAGSVVTRDIPPRTVAGGIPARHIKSLDEYIIDHFAKAIIPLTACTHTELKRELTAKLWRNE